MTAGGVRHAPVRFVLPMDEFDEREICLRIRQARDQSKLTQLELAQTLGVSVGAIAKYERNQVPWRRLKTIAEVTGADIRWLVFGQDPLERIDARLAAIESKLSTGPAVAAPPAPQGALGHDLADAQTSGQSPKRKPKKQAQDSGVGTG
jgi:transcriptional regulator with XRE-family HTH domain